MRFAEVAVYEPKVRGVFHYHIPPTLADAVQTGRVVEVPFGERRLFGVVLRLLPEAEVESTKPIAAVLPGELSLTEAQLRLARHLATATLAPLAACIALMLPPKVLQQADVRYGLTESAPTEESALAALSDTERRVLTLLRQRGPLRGRQIARALPRRGWRGALQRLIRRGWVSGESVLPRPRLGRQVRMVRLAVPPEEVQTIEAGALSRRAEVDARRRRMLMALAAQSPRAAAWLYAETGGNRGDLETLAKRGWVEVYAVAYTPPPLTEMAAPSPTTPPPLTPAQEDAWARVLPALHRAAAGEVVPPFLLHGVTGSGKTELYLRATAETLRLGRQAVILVPEIALTPQTVQRFRARFGAQVGVLHSRLSDGERLETWLRVRRGELRILIGPRSALFAPFPRLGLIVVDECHEEAYYEADRLPHYHAREAALAYGEMLPAVVLLGSATPDVVTYARARRGALTLLELPDRILAHREAFGALEGQGERFQAAEGEALAADLPPIEVVDMRAELRAGHTGIFSRALLHALEQTLVRGEQAILYLNRRGSAPYVFCRDCGYVARCPRCDVPLVFHREDNSLRCHHCGYRRKMPPRCPVCGSERWRPYGAGTQKVEAEVLRHFPQARVLRWDADTTRTKGSHEAILGHFVARRADVLVGTQMLAKGLDLPYVTLVGVVLADVGLTLPDYRAAERGFQLLVQVAGRAGRSPLGGQVIFQTYLPDHYAILAAARHDFAGFYHQELAYRRRLGYPPYAHLVRLVYRGWDAARAEAEAKAMARRVRAWLREGGHAATQVIGPAPCFWARVRGRYCWHLVLRGPDPAAILRGRRWGDWDVAVDPPGMLS